MRRRAGFRAATLTAVVALAGSGLALAQPSIARADGPVAPVTFPRDGAKVFNTTPTVTATYLSPYVTGKAHLTVRDSTTGAGVPCASPINLVSGDEELRCQLPPLTGGDVYTAYAHEVDLATGDPQTTTWTFTASTPVLTHDTPVDYTSGSPSATYDRVLDSSTTVELFAESGQTRTIVPGTPSVSGKTATYAPESALADGEYALVVHAEATGDPASFTDTTDEFFAGSVPTNLDNVPDVTRAITGSVGGVPGMLTVTGTGPSGATLDLQLYDPTNPVLANTVAVTVPSCSSAKCPWTQSVPSKTLTGATTFAWRVFSDNTSVASTPDRLIQPKMTSPAAPTQVDVPDLVNAANVSAVPISVTVPAGDVGVAIKTSTSSPVGPADPGPTVLLAAVAGQVTTTVDLSRLYDGTLSVRALAFDSYGDISKGTLVQTTQEAVALAPTKYYPSDTEVRAQPYVQLTFDEPIGANSTLTLTTKGGVPVDGQDNLGLETLNFDSIDTPTDLPNGTVVTATLHAYAATCPSGPTPPCSDTFSRTWTERVDTVPPAPPKQLSCSPAAIPPSKPIATIKGVSAVGDSVLIVALPVLGGQQIKATVTPHGHSDGHGHVHWSTTMNLGHGPNGLYQFTAMDRDAAANFSAESAAVECGKGHSGHLTLEPRLRSAVVGERVLLHGRFTSETSGSPLAGRRVHLELLASKTEPNGTPLGSATTDSKGRWHHRVTVTSSGYIRASVAGTSTLLPSTSWTTAKPVKTVVRVPLHVTSPVHGSSSSASTPLVVQGTTSAYFKGATVQVVVTRSSHHITQVVKCHSAGQWSASLAVPAGHWVVTVRVLRRRHLHFSPHTPGDRLTIRITRT